MDSCQWKLPFPSIVDHSKVMYCCSSVQKEWNSIFDLPTTNSFKYLLIFHLIIYMKKFLYFDWLRAVQFFSKTVQKRVNSVEKEETNQAFWLVNDHRSLQMANQIFCFQINRTPWMAQFFPDCVINVRFFCFTISKFFMYIINR